MGWEPRRHVEGKRGHWRAVTQACGCFSPASLPGRGKQMPSLPNHAGLHPLLWWGHWPKSTLPSGPGLSQAEHLLHSSFLRNCPDNAPVRTNWRAAEPVPTTASCLCLRKGQGLSAGHMDKPGLGLLPHSPLTTCVALGGGLPEPQFPPLWDGIRMPALPRWRQLDGNWGARHGAWGRFLAKG